MAECYLDILAETIRNNWDQPALTDFYLTEDGTAQDTSRGNHYTYGEMYEEIVRVANLLTNLGLQKGDHIAICGANSAHWVIAYLAIAKIQGVSVTVMHSLQPEEIARLIEFSDAKAIFADSEIWEELREQSLPQIESIIALDNWDVLFGEKQIKNQNSKIKNGEYGFDIVEADSLAMICFTSGSTGNAKGVMLPYRSISANIIFLYSELKAYNRENIISILPIAHIYGIYNEILRPLCLGTNVHIIRSVLNITTIIKCYQLIKPIYAVVVPAILEALVNRSNSLDDLYSFIKSALGGRIDEMSIGGAGMSLTLEEKLLGSRLPIAKGYGMTECGPLISVATYRNNSMRLGSVGFVLPSLILKIAPNGEILVKGDNVMLGYYKDPGATAAKIDQDGWLHTGDKGHLDEDGYLYVEGRLEQDIIVLPNGENIRPDNIESLINALPEVKESIVLAREGRLVAIVVPNHQSPITNADLRRSILRMINPQLPLFSQLYDVEITDQPLQRTEKQTLKRYLYK